MLESGVSVFADEMGSGLGPGVVVAQLTHVGPDSVLAHPKLSSFHCWQNSLVEIKEGKPNRGYFLADAIYLRQISYFAGRKETRLRVMSIANKHA